ncbi:hypothetical protein ACTG16_21920 [Aeromonas sp. 23P]|uniref:hypothetical protein n=1 Tax=Aeromonas sp. 23P TaxID=3452716 RepID=UPI003F79BCFE|nr:hypothetical protein [Aeromonas veronii]
MFFKFVTALIAITIALVVGVSFFKTGSDLVLGGADYTYFKKIERDMILIEASIDELARKKSPISIDNIMKAGYFTQEPSILGSRAYKVSADGGLISASINRKSKIINDSVCHLINGKETIKIIRFEVGMTSSQSKHVFVSSMADIYPKKTSCSIIVYFTPSGGPKMDVNTEYLIARFRTSEKMREYIIKSSG